MGYRGHKADLWEGGHRVPFVARWPGTVKVGTSSAAVVCLTDLMATCAEITGAKVPETAGEDSVSFLPVLRGEKGNRETLVSHSIAGHFAIRKGAMKLMLTPGSGGWSDPRPGSDGEKGLPADQLYDLAADRGEQKNLIAVKAEVAKELADLLDKQVSDGRSTPGAPQKNAVEVQVRKGAKKRAAKGK
jgi:arylsulfatase A-like enzyme